MLKDRSKKCLLTFRESNKCKFWLARLSKRLNFGKFRLMKKVKVLS
jgi:hypothetical protein